MNSTSARVASIGENSTSSTSDLRVRDRGARLALDVLARGLQLVLDVDVRGRDERVDARSLGVAYGLRRRASMSAAWARARPAMTGPCDLAGDRLHGLEVAGRGDREAGLDDVDAQARELVGDLELLGRVQRDARRLLAVAQRRVEDQYSVGVHVVMSLLCRLRPAASSRLGLRLRGRHALFPPKGEEKKSEVEQERHALRLRLAERGPPSRNPGGFRVVIAAIRGCRVGCTAPCSRCGRPTTTRPASRSGSCSGGRAGDPRRDGARAARARAGERRGRPRAAAAVPRAARARRHVRRASSSRPTTTAPTSACCSGTRTASRRRAGTARSRSARGPSSPAWSRPPPTARPTWRSTCPSGRVVARVRCAGGRGRRRRPSATCRRTCSPAACRCATRRGRCAVDVAYGGAIYASLAAAAAGLAVEPARYAELIALGREVKAALDGTDARPPSERRPAVRHLRDDPLRRPRRRRDRPAPAQRDGLRRRRGRPLAVRLGHLRARRRCCTPTAASRPARSLRHDSIVGTAFARRGRATRRGRGPRRVVAEVERHRVPHRRAPLRPRPRATRSAPGSCCGERACPFLDAAAVARAARRRGAPSTRSRRRCAPASTPSADPPRQAVGGRGRPAPAHAVGRAGRASASSSSRSRPATPTAACRGSRASTCCSTPTTLAPAALARRHRADHPAHRRRLGARRPPPRRARRAAPACVFGTGPQALGARRGAPGGRAAARAGRRRRARPRRASRRSPSAARASTALDAGGRGAGRRRRRRPRRLRDDRARAAVRRRARARRRDGRRDRLARARAPARSTSASPRRATVVVESRASALREAGDVIAAIEDGRARPRTRSCRSPRLVRGEAAARRRAARGCSRAPGMAWEDLVVAAAVQARAAG